MLNFRALFKYQFHTHSGSRWLAFIAQKFPWCSTLTFHDDGMLTECDNERKTALKSISLYAQLSLTLWIPGVRSAVCACFYTISISQFLYNINYVAIILVRQEIASKPINIISHLQIHWHWVKTIKLLICMGVEFDLDQSHDFARKTRVDWLQHSLQL